MKNKTNRFSAFLCAFCHKSLLLSHFLVTLSHTEQKTDALEYPLCGGCYGKVCFSLIQIGWQNLEELIAKNTERQTGLKK